MGNYIKILGLILLQTTTSTFSCEPAEDAELIDGFTVYTIEAGAHKSSQSVMQFEGEVMEFKVKFDSTAQYATTDPANQNDINKLYGFNDCGQEIYNHVHSARFGWRWYYGELQLYAYCYTDKELTKEYLKSIQIDSVYNCSIAITDSSYIFSINERVYQNIKRGCSDKSAIKYRLYPYFGGDETAPHDINVFIEDLSQIQ